MIFWGDPLHGDGYQFWSGIAGDFGLFTVTATLLLKHNCHEHRCPRIGRVLCADGHHRCKRHYRQRAHG